MALNASGPISLGGSTSGQSINLELGLSATAAISLNDAAVRTLLGVASGAITLNNAYSKSNNPYTVATGGTVTTSGNYKIHTFTSSSTFTVSAPGSVDSSVDILLVGGGGGGGSQDASGSGGCGGGGAGGMKEVTSVAVTATSYAITVGTGGTPGSSTDPDATRGINGSSSSAISYSVSGGGGGGGGRDTAQSSGSNGGSGGGAAWYYGYSGGTAVSGEGNVGANINAGVIPGGGGGGASAAGNPAVGTRGGAGGAGRSSSYSGAEVTYAGGGGAGGYGNTQGLGGSGGGGNGQLYGGNNAQATDGSSGVGGGGGGGYGQATRLGGTGGSGIVIIRYLYQ